MSGRAGTQAFRVLFVALACAGCGGTGSGAVPGADPVADPGGDVAVVEDVADIAADAGADVVKTLRLEFADPTDDLGHPTAGATTFTVFPSYAQPRDLRVRALEGDAPAAGVPITFAFEGDVEEGIALAPTSTQTGEDGVATAKVEVFKQAGLFLFQVRVCIDGAPEAACLVFQFHGGEAPKCVPLQVIFAPYEGLYMPLLTNAEVRLFLRKDGKPACDDLRLDSLPAANIVSPVLASLTTAAVFSVLPNLQKDHVQSYAVLGMAMDDGGTIKAWGCAEATVEWGACTTARVTLVDIPPHLSGAFDVTTTIDLVTGLDAEIRNILQYVADLLSDRAPGMLPLFCTADPGDAVLADFCARLFADPGQPSVTSLTEAGTAVLAILEAGAGPDVYMDPGVTPDLFANVRLLSTLAFACGPDDAGVFAPGCIVHTWKDLGLHWTIGTGCSAADPECGWNEFTLAEVLGLAGPPQTLPNASVAELALTLGPHSPPLAYGVIVRFVIERFLLPRVYGDGTDGLPAVDSFEDFLGAVLGGRACLSDDTCCAGFADAVAAATPDIAPGVALAACDALRAKGPAYLRSLLTGLDPAGASLQVATKTACPLGDSNKDMKVEAIGDPASPCAWDAAWTLGGSTFAPQATFFGVAQ